MCYIFIYTHTIYNTHTQNVVLFSHKKNKMVPFAATWMDLEIIILNEAKSEKDKYSVISLICRI